MHPTRLTWNGVEELQSSKHNYIILLQALNKNKTSQIALIHELKQVEPVYMSVVRLINKPKFLFKLGLFDK